MPLALSHRQKHSMLVVHDKWPPDYHLTDRIRCSLDLATRMPCRFWSYLSNQVLTGQLTSHLVGTSIFCSEEAQPAGLMFPASGRSINSICMTKARASIRTRSFECKVRHAQMYLRAHGGCRLGGLTLGGRA